MNEKYLCIHGHFYQPPRDNPWLEAIEYQPSAIPFHDWNERVTAECYAPNTRARVHRGDGLILELINNFTFMSFNFGPTLLSWLENARPWVYEQILEGDRKSIERYNGHGSAIAQVYNHIIMPLASKRDKLTQIRWGISDFRHRFGRDPEGMWLAETAVDSGTLQIMAEEGIKFTILSPYQALKVRPLDEKSGSATWQDVSGGQIDPTRAYRVRLDKKPNSHMAIFFYDGPLSRSVAYEKMLASGENFLSRIEQAFTNGQVEPKLVSIATDGESYGHHFKFGDLALSWIFHKLKGGSDINLTNYASFLELFPPKHEVVIKENTSWSCAHGVDRWKSDCGCKLGSTPEWNQAWRAPLRQGLDSLSHSLAEIFEKEAGSLFKDPWEAREDYITLLLMSSDDQKREFLDRHALKTLSYEDKVKAFQLLESQRMSMFMFTSCGWFFDDISGLEATQVIKYASRAIDLVSPWDEKNLEADLLKTLAKAKSNDPAQGSGDQIYHKVIASSRMDPSRTAAHYALAGQTQWREGENLFSGIVKPLSQLKLEGNNFQAILGDVGILEKRIPKESRRIYLLLKKSFSDATCLVGRVDSQLDLEQLASEIRLHLSGENLSKTEELFKKMLGKVDIYSINDLIPDSRRFLIHSIASTLETKVFDALEKDKDIKEFMDLLDIAKETSPEMTIDLMALLLTHELSGLMTPDGKNWSIDWDQLRPLAEQAKTLKKDLNKQDLRKKALAVITHIMRLIASERSSVYIDELIDFLNLTEEMGLKPDLWKCQNMFYDLYQDDNFYQGLNPEPAALFRELGRRIGFAIEGLENLKAGKH